METIKIYGCRYVCEYSDGMPLSSSEHNFRTKEERAEFLSEYDEDEMQAWKHPESHTDEEIVDVFNDYKSIYKFA